MKNHNLSRPLGRPGFTLVELLVVIAIIAVLAGLLLPIGGRVRQTATRNKANAELEQVAFAIETYKVKLGHYPPDAPNSPGGLAVNPLYFELLGTKLVGNEYQTLDGSARLAAAAVPTVFGAGLSGFVNCTRAEGDDAPAARAFVAQLKPSQYGRALINGLEVPLLASSIRWPQNHPFQPVPGSNPAGLNPWRYNVSNPTNNPGSFDLWVDLLIGGKTNRISNWSRQPQIVHD